MKYERLVFEIRHLHRTLRRKRVRRCDYQGHLVAMNRDCLEMRVLDRESDDSEIKRSVHHSLCDRAGDRSLNVDLDLRISLFERGEHFGQDVQTRRLVRSEPEFAASQAP